MAGKGGPPPLGFQCQAKTRAGHPCKAPKVRGANRCVRHGGRTSPANNRKRVELARTKRLVGKSGLPIAISPAEAMQAELDRSNGNVVFLESIIRELGEGDLVTRLREERRVGKLDSYTSVTVEPAIGVWVELWLTERRHSARIANDMVRNGLAAVQLSINAEVAGIFDRAMTGILEDVGISVADPKVRRIIVARMQEAHEESQRQLTMQVVR
jgi:hypothetical protein